MKRESLSKNSQNTIITLTDQSGKVVLTKAGERTAGSHEFIWDGKDMSGLPVDDGAYNLSVTAIGFEDEPITTKVHVFGHVTGVSMANGTKLDLGGVEIPLEKILTITESGG